MNRTEKVYLSVPFLFTYMKNAILKGECSAEFKNKVKAYCEQKGIKEASLIRQSVRKFITNEVPKPEKS